MKKLSTLLFLCLFTFGAWAQWTSQDNALPGTKSIIDMHATSATNVWAVANPQPAGAGTASYDFTHTNDGGLTWTAGLINGAGASAYSNSSIYGIDSNTAWVCMYNPNGGGGGVYQTTNGGSNWTRRCTNGFTNANSFPDFIYFKDANNGIVVGDPVGTDFEIYTTTDAGATWTLVPGSTMPNAGGTEYGLTANYCAMGNTIWFGTTTGRVYRTTDFGATWTAANTGANYITSVAFKNNLEGLALDSVSTLYKTVDGGNTWTSLGATGDYYSFLIRYVPGTTNTYIAAGRDLATGTMEGSAYSTDGGLSWTMLDQLVYHNAFAIWDANSIWSGGYRDAAQAATFPGMYFYSGTPFVTSPQLTLANPNGGETLLGGTNYTINWSSYQVANVKIEYTTNGGNNWNAIANSVPNVNSYTWAVPQINSTNCKVRISDAANTTLTSMSAATFSISSNVGMNELSLASLNVFPSMCNTALTVQNAKAKQWSIIAADGREVMNGELSVDNIIAVNALAPAMYVLRIGNENIRFVKE